MPDMSAELKLRLLNLIEQVKRDQLALGLQKHAEGDQVLAVLFDSLQATLHNLNASEDAADPCGD